MLNLLQPFPDRVPVRLEALEVSTVFASPIKPDLVKFSRLVRLMKSYTPRGEENLAVPLVGSVWFGPAA